MSLEIPVVTVVPPVSKEQAAPKEIETPEIESLKDTPEQEVDPKSQDSFSKRFSALNRERKKISQQETELKKQMAALESEKAEMAKWRAEQEEIKKSMNPLKALKAYGYEYEDAANAVLNDERPTPELQIKALREELESFKAAAEAEKAELKIQKEQAERAVLEKESGVQVEQAIASIKSHLASKPEYDALTTFGLEKKIYKEIADHYEKTDEVLLIDDLAKRELAEIEKLLEMGTKTTIYKSKYGEPTPKTVNNAPKTLSNALSSQTAPSEKTKIKTDEERMKNALALLSK